MEFAKLVKAVRRDLGFSQEQLARGLNISFSTVNRWENKKANPSPMAKKVFFDFCESKGLNIAEYQEVTNDNH